MERNVGFPDRFVRIVLGAVMLLAVYLVDNKLRWLGLIGIVPIATAAMGWCPLYTLFGMRTCKPKNLNG